MARKLVILLGPTASGKTDYSLSLAKKYDSPIISCDSRQIYKEMSVGTAVPSAGQLAEVQHYFIQCKSVTEYYTAGMYEMEALKLIDSLFEQGHETLVMTGGSMFYIDAVCNGIPDVPPADLDLRARLNSRIEKEGALAVSEDLKELDPEAYNSIDRSNGMRVLRALEVCITTGRPFSEFKKGPKKRSFEIEKIGISRPREVLYGRINARVGEMMENGLLEEVERLLPYRKTTALQTVGYSELFDYIDGKNSLDEAVELIRRNTRHYAKRQLTWWRRDPSINWIEL